MLVLSRKLGEEICIGSGIKVTALAIQKGRVRLGFAAPRDLQIHREETCREIGFASPPGRETRWRSAGMVG